MERAVFLFQQHLALAKRLSSAPGVMKRRTPNDNIDVLISGDSTPGLVGEIRRPTSEDLVDSDLAAEFLAFPIRDATVRKSGLTEPPPLFYFAELGRQTFELPG